MSRRGRFIVLEGIDGAGTTTLLNALRAHFGSRERRCFFTHEPSDGPVGMLIRLALQKRLLGTAYDAPGRVAGEVPAFDSNALALLFAADRADHVAAQILPNLEAGRDVICDRYLLSTLAYQGQHAPAEWLMEINSQAIVPDLTVFLDLPPSVADERMRASRWTRDIYETVEQQRSIRDLYHEIIDRAPAGIGEVWVVDGSRSPAQVAGEVIERLDALLEEDGDDFASRRAR
jgi:dTMP kinase